MNMIKSEDEADANMEKPYRVGVPVSISLNTSNSGIWMDYPGGGKLWRLHLRSPGAVALGVDYSNFYLPVSSDLFIYNPDHSQIAGAYTSFNNTNGHSFATRPLAGDELILEYYQPEGCKEEPSIIVSGLNYIYRGMDVGLDKNGYNFGASGPCEVNIHCSEGDNWLAQSHGVVRMLTRVNGQSIWCTGSLLNNTHLDFSPIVLTANHCSINAGNIASSEDLEKWIFYFNYEATGCDKPLSEPGIQSMTGAEKLASSQNPVTMGSDFYLVKLKQDIPVTYNPYFNGWKVTDVASPSGVGIHHPEGDIKKISTYTQPIVSGKWESTDETHWKVNWSATTHGYGVTEGGSSGSPLFNSEGLLIGSLTGGESACSNAGGTDYYGKISYSWASNGTADSMQLRPWLDPLNLGRTLLRGMSRTVQFEANVEQVPIGGAVDFRDLTASSVYDWKWQFEGGEPSESSDKNPSGIVYNSFGRYKVSLRVSYLLDTDSLVDSLTRTDYIQVSALVYPNPTKGALSVFTNVKNSETVKIEVFTPLGVLVKSQSWSGDEGPLVSIDLPTAGNLFIVRIDRAGAVQTEKVIVLRP